jgi:hypothetical protein
MRRKIEIVDRCDPRTLQRLGSCQKGARECRSKQAADDRSETHGLEVSANFLRSQTFTAP